MSYYTDKYFNFKKEGTWGTYATPNTYPNYLLSFDFETAENQIKEFVIAGARDKRSRAWVEEEVTGRMEMQMVSGKWFEFVMGSVAGTTTTSFTYSVASTLPSFSAGVARYPTEANNTICSKYSGIKVDSAELTLEEGEDVALVLNLAAKSCEGGTVVSEVGSAPTIDYSEEPYTYIHGTMSINNQAITRISRAVLSINNNLTAEYSAGAQTIHAVGLREGALDIGLRLTCSSNLSSLQTWALARSGYTISLKLIKTDRTITISLPNCAFDASPNEATGIEPMDLEFTMTAYPTAAGGNACTITEAGASSWTLTPY